jgi:DNA polymerase-3 subunit delta
VTPEAAIAQARKGALLPIYLVTGDEQFLRDQVVAELRAASLAGGVAAFNEDKYTAGEIDADKVIAAARTVPMMAARRFVLVRGAERWDAGEGADDNRASPLDRIAQYAAQPIDSTCLVITAAKLDGRRKLSALAKKNDFVVACDKLDPRVLPMWIIDRAKSKGHAIERDVAELLAQIAGPELAYVSDALERLSLYCLDEAGAPLPITEDAVSECVARVRAGDTWKLVDLIGRRDLGGALKLLADTYVSARPRAAAARRGRVVDSAAREVPSGDRGRRIERRSRKARGGLRLPRARARDEGARVQGEGAGAVARGDRGDGRGAEELAAISGRDPRGHGDAALQAVMGAALFAARFASSFDEARFRP